MTGFAPPPSGHADELLSAHLDGELTVDESAWVQRHLAECRNCADEAAAIDDARRAILVLPTLDSSEVVGSVIARHRQGIRTGIAFIGAASVIIGAIALTAAVSRASVVPDTERLVHAHMTSDHDAMFDAEVEEMGGLYQAPGRLGEGKGMAMTLSAIYDGHDVAAMLYTESRGTVSVFQQPGRVEWSGLTDGDVEQWDELRVWRRHGTPAVYVAEVGHLVVTVVSEDDELARAALDGLPPGRRDAVADRLHDAAARLTSVFSFLG